jgi:hypothetical protein
MPKIIYLKRFYNEVSKMFNELTNLLNKELDEVEIENNIQI